MKCAFCSSKEYLVSLTPISYEDSNEEVNYCIFCLQFAMETAFGKGYLKVLEKKQEIDELKYQIDQKKLLIDYLIKDGLEGKEKTDL
jgi:hypothetical protein